jgi:predicted PurR-regulated permease PerM
MVGAPVERLRLTTRSAVRAVLLLGATLAALRILLASQRVIGWILAAATVAALLYPLVSGLSRRIPRGLAVAIVALGTVASISLVTYSAVHDLVRETHKLQEAAPRRIAELERSERFGRIAKDFELRDRVQRLVDSAPERLRGGTPSEALRSAATRGVAFLATGVLSLFFLLHGPRVLSAAARQIHDPDQRARVERVAFAAYTRAFGYVRRSILMSAVAGLLAFAIARAADVPGPAPLAVWAAMWDVVPLLGAVVGTLPIVVLAAAVDPAKGLLLACLFTGYQVFEGVVLQRRVERRTLRVGPFLTVAGGFAGLELYGLGGALLVLLVVILAVAVADEVAPEVGEEGAS